MAKTLIEQLTDAKARVAKLEAAIKSGSIINNVQEGDNVTIKFGRAEKVRNITGKVVGLKTDDDGNKTVVVLSDDFKTFTIPARDIIENADAMNRDPGSEVLDTVAEEDLAQPDEIERFVNEGGSTAVEASEDPLSQA